MSKLVLTFIIGILPLLGGNPLLATVIIAFEQGPIGGTVTVSGGNASTTDIPIDIMTIEGTGATDGSYDLTGACSGGGQDADGSACLAFNTATGTISITGGVVGLPGLPNGTLLLSGGFASSTVSAQSVLLVASGMGSGTENATLLTDVNTSGPFQFFGFSLDASTSGTGGHYLGFSNDIITTGDAPVAEPATVTLLGGVLLFVAAALREKVKRS